MNEYPKTSLPEIDEDGSSCRTLRETFRHRQRAEELLLEALERVADGLPSLDRELLNAIERKARQLAAVLDANSLLNALQRQRSVLRQARLRGRIQRLVLEERADSAVVLELTDAIERLLSETQTQDVDALSYLLRCVLENRRRHLAWFAEIIEQDLTSLPENDADLQAALARCSSAAESLQLLYPTH